MLVRLLNTVFNTETGVIMEAPMPAGGAMKSLLPTKVESESSPVFKVEGINNTAMPDLATMPYRPLIFGLCLRAASWQQFGKSKEDKALSPEDYKEKERKVYNAFYRYVNEFGTRFVEHWE